jgi:dipeptidyl aminopeptidase/acylaminoacyl peptidase
MKQHFIGTLMALLAVLPTFIFCQKKAVELADIHRWKKIDGTQVSTDGRWTAYVVAPYTEGDSELRLHDATTGQTRHFARGTEPRLSDDAQWLAFRAKPHLDSLKTLRRKKVKDDDLPKDTLVLLHLPTGRMEWFPRVKSFILPEKWNDWLFVHLEPAPLPKAAPAPKDTTKTAAPDSTKAAPTAKAAKPKKESKDNGSVLLVRSLKAGFTDTLPYVLQYAVSETYPDVVVSTSGIHDAPQWKGRANNVQAGAYHVDLQRHTLHSMYRGKGKIQHLSMNRQGGKAVFLVDTDTTKARIRPWQLAYWDISGGDTVRWAAGSDSKWLPTQPADALAQGRWTLSEHTRPVFSDDASRVFLGMAPPPILADTLQLPEEVVNVEVWTWDQPRQYTELENRLEADRKRSWPVVWHLRRNEFVPLHFPDQPDMQVTLRAPREAKYALGIDTRPYALEGQWTGEARKDVYVVDLNSGSKKLIINGLRCKPSLSPDAGYVLWWSEVDSSWWAQSVSADQPIRLTGSRKVRFWDETTDVPDYPEEYGTAGWLEGDQAVLLYDRYDIWQVDPTNPERSQRLTRGRERQVTYRYVSTHPEARSIRADERVLLRHFDHRTKASGYAWLDMDSPQVHPWLSGDYAFARSVTKARRGDALIFSVENFGQYPDLRRVVIPDTTRTPAVAEVPAPISLANPQQVDYQWPTIELVHWLSPQGDSLTGMLIKPGNFDATKKYPMIVNFYERQSDELHAHRAPTFGRSQINFVQYASRGYLIFIPDIVYRVGQPGESAYDAVTSGVTRLIERGWVDPKRIGLQGHSWGGYQAAYLVTRTNLFACAEAGAPVANMTSAYGGIRWESGLNRQFQYEKQQSRIGATLWERPELYLQNSPLFSLDRVQTPLLILHNDADGAVPWQQGIELFTALRRLGKPAWLLNYNDEPHWPVKLQNRVDFQTRMQGFFDHYLMGAPEPRWMQRGLPPIEKGVGN